MPDKQMEWNFTGPFSFVKVKAICEETGVEPGDTCDFCVQVTNGDPAIALNGVSGVKVQAWRVFTPGNTLNILGGEYNLGTIDPGATEEGHWLVRAGTVPANYTARVRVTLFGQAHAASPAGNYWASHVFEMSIP